MSDSSASALLPAQPAPNADAVPESTPIENPDPVRSLPPRAKCIWCGSTVKYQTETEARDHWGYCTPECRDDFLGELECDPEKAFNKSRRLKRRPKAPPAFIQARQARRAREQE